MATVAGGPDQPHLGGKDSALAVEPSHFPPPPGRLQKERAAELLKEGESGTESLSERFFSLSILRRLKQVLVRYSNGRGNHGCPSEPLAGNGWSPARTGRGKKKNNWVELPFENFTARVQRAAEKQLSGWNLRIILPRGNLAAKIKKRETAVCRREASPTQAMAKFRCCGLKIHQNGGAKSNATELGKRFSESRKKGK